MHAAAKNNPGWLGTDVLIVCPPISTQTTRSSTATSLSLVPLDTGHENEMDPLSIVLEYPL